MLTQHCLNKLNAPRTAKDALIAEMLGDMGKLHDSLEELKTVIPFQAALIEKQFSSVVGQLEKASSDIPKNVEASSKYLRSELTRGIDDVVGVANETLLKFSAKIVELQQSIGEVQKSKEGARSELATAAKMAVSAELKAAGGNLSTSSKTTPTALVLTGCVAFLFGAVFTALLCAVFLK